jgi:hypothetical protein
VLRARVDRVAAIALHDHRDDLPPNEILALVSQASRVADVWEKNSAIAMSREYSG